VGKYRRIIRKLDISLEELQNALAFIRRLNPKPGACFGDGTEVVFITPDVVVEKIDGQYVVASSGRLPRLVVNSFYRSMLRQSGDENVRGFIKKNLEGALWFIKSVEHRKKIIYQVTLEIVRVQEPFLEKGLHHLKPLTLKAVAAAIGVHESTVSRAAANKYMQTPRGIFPMKFFFAGSVDGEAGALYASASIKQALRELIATEDPAEPLSDRQLMERLCRQGIKISRRTVAKYREELEIPASFRRRSL
jgi:RNA polymerase sigma-54 factor